MALANIDVNRLPQYLRPQGQSYSAVPGAVLGLNNNYQYAVYPDGSVENLYQGVNPNGVAGYEGDWNILTGAPASASVLRSEREARDGGYNWSPSVMGHITADNQSNLLGTAFMGAFGGMAAGGIAAGGAGSGMSAADAYTLGSMTEGGAAAGGGAAGYGAGSSPMLLADAGTTATDVGGGYGSAATTGGEPLDIFGSTAETLGYSTDPGVWDPAGNYTMQGNWQTTGGNWWDKYVDPKYLPYLKTLSDLAGKAAPAALGAYGANQQANAYGDLANKYLAIGGPSRARYEASFNPGFSMANDPGYSDALDQTTKATLHGLSVNGNPSNSPNAWTQTLKDVNAKFAFPALNEFRRVNAGAGGLAALTSAAPGADAASVNAGRGVYDAIGGGVADVLNPPRSLSDLLREFKRAGY